MRKWQEKFILLQKFCSTSRTLSFSFYFLHPQLMCWIHDSKKDIQSAMKVEKKILSYFRIFAFSLHNFSSNLIYVYTKTPGDIDTNKWIEWNFCFMRPIKILEEKKISWMKIQNKIKEISLVWKIRRDYCRSDPICLKCYANFFSLLVSLTPWCMKNGNCFTEKNLFVLMNCVEF